MKRFSLLILFAFVALIASAQREYRGVGGVTVVTKGIRVSHDDVYVDHSRVENRSYCNNEPLEFDDVIENNAGTKRVLVKDNYDVEYYHISNVRERHINLGSSYGAIMPPTRISKPHRRDIRVEGLGVRKSQYHKPVTPLNDGYENCAKMRDNNKWFFYFDIGSSYLIGREELGHLIDYAKTHKSCNFYIDSYADIETGTFNQNKILSEQRSEVIVDILLNEGINPNRINIKNNGCSVQPYNTNNLNRCVVVRAAY